MEETLNELLGKEAESPDTGYPLRAQRGPSGATAAAIMTATSPRPPVTSRPHAAAQVRVLRDSHHRAVSPPGELRGGGPHRDVSGRRFRAPCGGHHGGTVGQQGFARHHQRAEQEILCPHRGLAEPPLCRRTVSVCLIVGDKCMGMLEAVGEVFPDAKYQRCTVHFYRNIFSVVPKSKVKIVAKCSRRSTRRRAKKRRPVRRRKPWSPNCAP